mgnify:CR=1 FL=1
MENENARTRNLRLTSGKEALINMWQTQLLQLAEALESQVTKTFIGSTTSVVCHGDLWPDHTYFQDAQFSGFVDFGALNYTSPALDLAQLIIHFGGWQTAHEALSTYTQILPLTKQDHALITQFVAWDLIHEGCWALQELQKEQLPEIEQQAHWHNLRFLLPSINVVKHEL